MAKGGQTAKPGATAMAAAWRLFDEGDKLAARRQAVKVLAAPPSVADAEEAKELLERVSPPPSFKLFALLAAGVLAGLLLVSLLRG